MDTTDLNLSRRARLQSLLDTRHFQGNKRALGIALGFKDGAYVRQLLEGERPISEKLILKIHAMKGGVFRGWFDAENAEAVQHECPDWPLGPFITPDQWQQVPPELRSVGAAAALRAIREAQALMSPASAMPEGPSRKRPAAGGM